MHDQTYISVPGGPRVVKKVPHTQYVMLDMACKRINQDTKKVKILGFTIAVIWGSELRDVEKMRFTQFWYGIY